jgi:hypothetical protein
MGFLVLQRHLDCRPEDHLVVHRLLTGIVYSSTECLDIHIGGAQTANLGDGNGNVAQHMELRQEQLSLPIVGTCLESAIGGNHFRMYRQNGADHPTGALFLACVAYFLCFARSLIKITRSVSVEEVVPKFLQRICQVYL